MLSNKRSSGAKLEKEQSILSTYVHETQRLLANESTTEQTFYTPLQQLISGFLSAQELPFEVRINTSQQRRDGGTDLPDIAFYDGEGTYPVVFGEVKLPEVEIDNIAYSTDQNDQIGRYLARTRVVLICNIRSFGLLAVDPEFSEDGPVPPEKRQLLNVVEFWPSLQSLKKGKRILDGVEDDFRDLLETAVTQFASIAEPFSLAKILARQARIARADLPKRFSEAIQPLLNDFAKALGLHIEGEEGEEFLRSSLIQTIFYSLFAGWTLWYFSDEDEEFRWQDLGNYLKIPFLAELFYELRHPARFKELGMAPHLNQATATLLRVDSERFFKYLSPDISYEGFEKYPASTAIIYFYEPFLEAFDPDLRKNLGVWYTPPEVVQYQVRKVDLLLKEKLGCDRGFADDRVVVLDPCCGTGAYLFEVVRLISVQLVNEGTGALLASKLLEILCKRVIGFEILTAPFVIAQLQLYLILSELGVAPDSTNRPAVYLTNALTGWEAINQLQLQFPELQQEYEAANQIKREEKIIVVMGNPPYNRFAGLPVEEEAGLVDHYKGIKRDSQGKQIGNSELYEKFQVRKQLLDDLYIRFFRLAEIRIGEKAEYGVVSFISNYSFLSGRSHPLMRESLLKKFDTIWIDSLNGDKYRTGKVIPKGLPGAGSSDQSIFSTSQDPRGIQVGTAITTFLKNRTEEADQKGIASVFYRDFWGLADDKRSALLRSFSIEQESEQKRKKAYQTPEGPRDYEEITPTLKTRWMLTRGNAQGGFEEWPSIDELFPVRYQGVNPNRGIDGSLIDVNSDSLEKRMKEYFSQLSFEKLQALHPELVKKRARYDPEAIRNQLLEKEKFDPQKIVPYQLFPFDLRYIYYETSVKLLNERRLELWENLDNNRFLIAVPQPRQISESRPLSSTTLFDLHLHDRGSVAFPVFSGTESSSTEDLFSINDESGRPQANLPEATWFLLKNHWKLDGEINDERAIEIASGIQEIAWAIGNSPDYQKEHADALAQDWLHIPIPKDWTVFNEIRQYGREACILLDPSSDAGPIIKKYIDKKLMRYLAVAKTKDGTPIKESDLEVTISYFGGSRGGWRSRDIKRGEYVETSLGGCGDLWLNENTFLSYVPERVWRLELGGYPVIKKWLGYRDSKRRSGGALSISEFEQLRNIIHRVTALLLLEPKLNTAYNMAIEDPFSGQEIGL